MESPDGTMEALTAIDRGTQTQPSYTCDTSTPGMRFYCCLVVTADGGVCYSSLIPVVVKPLFRFRFPMPSGSCLMSLWWSPAGRGSCL